MTTSVNEVYNQPAKLPTTKLYKELQTLEPVKSGDSKRLVIPANKNGFNEYISISPEGIDFICTPKITQVLSVISALFDNVEQDKTLTYPLKEVVDMINYQEKPSKRITQKQISDLLTALAIGRSTQIMIFTAVEQDAGNEARNVKEYFENSLRRGWKKEKDEEKAQQLETVYAGALIPNEVVGDKVTFYTKPQIMKYHEDIAHEHTIPKLALDVTTDLQNGQAVPSGKKTTALNTEITHYLQINIIRPLTQKKAGQYIMVNFETIKERLERINGVNIPRDNARLAKAVIDMLELIKNKSEVIDRYEIKKQGKVKYHKIIIYRK